MEPTSLSEVKNALSEWIECSSFEATYLDFTNEFDRRDRLIRSIEF